MTPELLFTKLYKMGSAEATALGDGLETIWWETPNDEETKARAIAYLKGMQDLAKKAEEVLIGARPEL
jgi:hypothetical protein